LRSSSVKSSPLPVPTSVVAFSGTLSACSRCSSSTRFSVSEFAQKTQRELAQTGEAVGILVEVAEHVIVLGAKIVVAAIFGKNQRIEKQAIAIGGENSPSSERRVRPAFLFRFRAAGGTSPARRGAG
jgi:hypothetical protein